MRQVGSVGKAGSGVVHVEIDHSRDVDDVAIELPAPTILIVASGRVASIVQRWSIGAGYYPFTEVRYGHIAARLFDSIDGNEKAVSVAAVVVDLVGRDGVAVSAASTLRELVLNYCEGGESLPTIITIVPERTRQFDQRGAAFPAFIEVVADNEAPGSLGDDLAGVLTAHLGQHGSRI